MGKATWERARSGLPRFRKQGQFYGLGHPWEARSQSNLNGPELRLPPQRTQKASPPPRLRAPRGGEVPKQSEWGAAPLGSPGAQKALPLPCFRTPQGR